MFDPLQPNILELCLAWAGGIKRWCIGQADGEEGTETIAEYGAMIHPKLCRSDYVSEYFDLNQMKINCYLFAWMYKIHNSSSPSENKSIHRSNLASLVPILHPHHSDTHRCCSWFLLSWLATSLWYSTACGQSQAANSQECHSDRNGVISKDHHSDTHESFHILVLSPKIITLTLTNSFHSWVSYCL